MHLLLMVLTLLENIVKTKFLNDVYLAMLYIVRNLKVGNLKATT